MAYEEKSAWVMLVLAVVAYAVYVVVVLSMAGETPLVEVDYAPALFITIGGSIVASIVIHIIVGMFTRRADTGKDQRDREIHRFGEYTGNAFLVIGALAAMVMAVLRWDYFWIANVLYLCFVLSAIVGSMAKLAAYRRGLPAW